jgi:sister chromatid cohesion protein DCC1
LTWKHRLTIKGDPDEDAVLCSAEKTYGMRSIGLSNTLLVVTPVPDDCASQFADDAIVIRDQLKEITELTLSVPKLHKLSRLLRDRQYDEGLEEEDDDDSVVGFPAKHIQYLFIIKTCQKRYTYQDAQRDVQASDAELRSALKDRRILIVNSKCISHN